MITDRSYTYWGTIWCDPATSRHQTPTLLHPASRHPFPPLPEMAMPPLPLLAFPKTLLLQWTTLSNHHSHHPIIPIGLQTGLSLSRGWGDPSPRFSYVILQLLPHFSSPLPKRIVDTLSFHFLASYSIFLPPCLQRIVNDREILTRECKVKIGQLESCIFNLIPIIYTLKMKEKAKF